VRAKDLFIKSICLRDHYNVHVRLINNPYIKKINKLVTIRLDEDTIVHVNNLAEDKVLPNQTLLISVYTSAHRHI
jgi:predicted DNA binding CopG/RHH family protein